tara:strand:- start:6773 stop:7180 length:408 start_codon:yes stop_codon:yes gene_type:complete
MCAWGILLWVGSARRLSNRFPIEVGGRARLTETFRLVLSNPSPGTLINTQAIGTILNIDQPVAPRFHRLHRLLSNGQFQLEFDLGDTGAGYEIQASSNLNQWITIGVVTGAVGNFQFTDQDSSSRVRRCYRAIAP